MSNEKPIEWIGSALDDLLDFPDGAKKEAGFQLHRVQHDLEPERWKEFKTVGAGVKEIIISEEGDAFRVMYVAKFEEAVYVLHSFQKKTQQTSKHDKQIASRRYKLVEAERRKKKGDKR
ncbi:type II toxin-antitoxin system RelE/ParE family toxin [Sansalvadorimonas verongulae]|uniref:type II toxin-antitoxin system RelE/ParE family toxin n=1 Tax=Sansalvadorimonas verongulae TaxID=2172824 RepID=UPI002E3742CA|nr:type II toxin-antitoxin system RelE/ParE family toxin [Sansalvadorimonas verongulae]MTI14181.1 type II toxin-antitoxin system RelE/ParE family toxin [Sansalvadorimonas verongulae]